MTHYYKCKDCHDDVSELEIIESFDGDRCQDCYYKVKLVEQDYPRDYIS